MHCPPRILSFVALTAVAVTTQLAYKLSQNANGLYEYNTQSAMTVIELIKLLMSLLLLWRTVFPNESLSSAVESYRQTFTKVPQRLYRQYFTLALSYGVYNQLIFVVMESSLDVGTFSLLKSTTPAIVSGINWWVLGQPLTLQQTLCMIIQCLGIVPVIMTSSTAKDVKIEFQPEEIILMMFCCAMESLTTVFNAVMIRSEADTSLHVQNIILYSYGVVVNLVLYFMMSSSQYTLFYGFCEPWVIFLMVLNSFVGLAITMIYKYGDAVLKTMTQPCASSILVFLACSLFGQPMDIIKAAGAGVVVIATVLYLRLQSSLVTDELGMDATVSPINRRKSGLLLAMLGFSLLGVTFMSLSNALSSSPMEEKATLKNGNYVRSVPRHHPSGFVTKSTLPIVLVIQALHLDDTSLARNENEKQRMIAENEAKVNLLELYRPSFLDMYYESPQYVGRHDVDVACGELAFNNLRTKCYSCVDQEIITTDEHRHACAAELFSFVETIASPPNTIIEGFLVVHADFYLAPGFVEQARTALIQHPSSIWTAGGMFHGPIYTRESGWNAITPLEYTSDPAPDPPPEQNPWWWKDYGPKLDDARAYLAQLFPSIVLNPGDKLAPITRHPSRWIDMYYVPATISHRFGVFARVMKQFHILNEIAVVEALMLAGIDGRVDGEFSFPCYGACCTEVNASQLTNHTFLNRYPCGHKIKLHDAESRFALATAWTAYYEHSNMHRVGE